MKNYYTYYLLDPRTNTPFYIGVGKVNRKSLRERYEDHEYEARRFSEDDIKPNTNLLKTRIILKILKKYDTIPIEILDYYKTKEAAFNNEKELIKRYGRRDIKTGILTNLTNGGEGVLDPSKETLAKRAASRAGTPSPLKGRKLGPYSDERKAKTAAGIRDFWKNATETDYQRQRDNRKKQIITEEHKRKISETMKGRPSPMKGKTAWNKGLTKDTDIRVKKPVKKFRNQLKEEFLGIKENLLL